MTPPTQPQQTTDTQPALTQAHTWAYVAVATLSTIFSAFTPKIQAYAAHHPTGTIVAGGLASVIAAFLPSAVKAGQP